MRPQKRKDYYQEIINQAQLSFKDHKLEKVGDKHWRIKRDNSLVFWTEIVVSNRYVIVFGDIDLIAFAYGPSDESAINWVSNMNPADYGQEKASIGTGSEVAISYSPEVALDDLDFHLGTYIEDCSEEEADIKREISDIFQSAKDCLKRGDPIESVQHQLADDISKFDRDYWEWIGDIGKVTSSRVIYGIAACKKLRELLASQEENVVF